MPSQKCTPNAHTFFLIIECDWEIEKRAKSLHVIFVWSIRRSFITSVIYFYWVPYSGRPRRRRHQRHSGHIEKPSSLMLLLVALAARGTERDAISDLCRFAELALFRFVAYVITEKNCASIPFKRRSNMSHSFLFG